MEHFKLKRQSTFDSFGAKKPFDKSRSEESRSSIHESKLSTIIIASFPFKKNQILLAKPAIDSNYTVVSSLDDVTEVRQVASSIVHELTSEFVEDKLEKDDGFLEFLLSRLIEPDLKEIIDLAFQQFPSVFDPKSPAQGQERYFYNQIYNRLTNIWKILSRVHTNIFYFWLAKPRNDVYNENSRYYLKIELLIIL